MTADCFPNDDEFCQVRHVHLDRVRQARANRLERREIENLAAVFKSLADATRLNIVLALREGEMCVCDLAAFIGLTESAVSHQLRRLRDLNLVRSRRAGQILYYNLDDAHVTELLEVALTHLRE